MQIKIGSITITINKSKPEVLTAYPTISEIMQKYGCDRKEAGLRLTGLHIDRQADARKARLEGLKGQI